MNPSESVIEQFIGSVRRSRKYRALDLPESMLRDIITAQLTAHKNTSTSLTKAREVLHGVIAPYLGDPNYLELRHQLQQIRSSDDQAIIDLSLDVLRSHASTAERIPHLSEFYSAIWEVTGTPVTIQDLACGLHPFALPWMQLPADVSYHAYDIHTPRVDAINDYFRLFRGDKTAHVQDILVDTPLPHTDVAFFFKEAHRFEQRQHGCLPGYFSRVNTDWLIVTLPAADLSGHHSLADRHHALIRRSISPTWPLTELQVGNELIFILRKNG